MSDIAELIDKGREQGFVTLEELRAAIPSDIEDADQLADIRTMLQDMGIEVRD